MTIGAMNRSAERRVVAADLRDDAPDDGAQPPRAHAAASASPANAQERGLEVVGARLAPAARRRCRARCTRPARMNSSSSQRSASSMTWLDTTIVAPASASARKWPQNWTRSSGSTPTVGSSRNSDGRPVDEGAGERQAPPLPARERAPAMVFARSASSTSARASATGGARVGAVRGGEEPGVLAHRERRVDAVALGHVADPRERSARDGIRTPRTSAWPSVAMRHARSAGGSAWSCRSRSGRAGRRCGRASRSKVIPSTAVDGAEPLDEADGPDRGSGTSGARRRAPADPGRAGPRRRHRHLPRACGNSTTDEF